jgi:sulfate transporter 3
MFNIDDIVQEGIAVGRSFAMYKNYNIDGNKEMIAIGTMNIVGSFTSCYLTTGKHHHQMLTKTYTFSTSIPNIKGIKMMTLTGPFSRSAVNYNAGCKTAVSNIVMSIAVMLTLLFLTPLFYYTPLVVLSAIIVSAMLGLIDYEAAIHLWKIDKFDFVVCISAYIGVVFGSVEIGLVIAVCINDLFVLTSHTSYVTNLSLIYKFMKLMCFLMYI